MEVSVCATPLLSSLIVSATGISKNLLDEVQNNKVLSDESINRASVLLATQLGEEIEGLRTPLPLEFGKKPFILEYFQKRSSEKDYVQIFHTGTDHWVTGIFPKGMCR